MLQSKSSEIFHSQASCDQRGRPWSPLLYTTPIFIVTLMDFSYLAWRRNTHSSPKGRGGTNNAMPSTSKQFLQITLYTAEPLAPDTSWKWFMIMMDPIWQLLDFCWCVSHQSFKYGSTSLKQVQVSSQFSKQMGKTHTQKWSLKSRIWGTFIPFLMLIFYVQYCGLSLLQMPSLFDSKVLWFFHLQCKRNHGHQEAKYYQQSTHLSLHFTFQIRPLASSINSDGHSFIPLSFSSINSCAVFTACLVSNNNKKSLDLQTK